jgi:hypothetical protein
LFQRDNSPKKQKGESLPPRAHFVAPYPLRLGAAAPKTPPITHLPVLPKIRYADDEDCYIIFSERGKAFNDRSLTVALQKARSPKTGISTAATILEKKASRDHIGLQIIDYFSLLSDKYQVIMDIDDIRTSEHGMFYSKNNRISLDKIKMRK